MQNSSLLLLLLSVMLVACATPTATPPFSLTSTPVSTTAAVTLTPETLGNTPGPGTPAGTPRPAPTRSPVITPTAANAVNLALLLAGSAREERALAMYRTFAAQAQNANAAVTVQFAENDAGRQQTQFEDALARGSSVIVLQAVDPDAAAPFVAAAHRAGARVIALDELVRSADLDLVVASDWFAAGVLQAQSMVDRLRERKAAPPWNFVILEERAGDLAANQLVKGYYTGLAPYIDKQQARIVADVAHKTNTAALAAETISTTLATITRTVHAVLANTPELARGAQQALDQARLSTPVLVSSAGLDLEGLRALCSDRLAFATTPIYPALGDTAARAALQLAQGQEVRTDRTVDVGDKPVPFLALAPRGVTTNTVQANLVQTGIFSPEQATNCLPPLAKGASVPKLTARATFSLWTDETDPVYPYLANLAAQFHQVNPTINISLTAFISNTLGEQVEGAVQGRNAPDLVWGSSSLTPRWAARGLMQPVDAQVDVTRFVSDSITTAQVNPGGPTLAVPISYGGHLLLFYNKALVTTPPVSTDDLLRLAPLLSKPGGAAFELAFDQNNPRLVTPWLYGFGSQVFAEPITSTTVITGTAPVTATRAAGATPTLPRPTPTLTPTGVLTASAGTTLTLNTRAMSETLAFLSGLRARAAIPPEGGPDVVDALFMDGRAAMVIQGEWAIGPYRAALGDNLGIAKLPIVSATNRNPISYSSGKSFFALNNLQGDRLTAARAFMEFVTSAPIQVEMAQRFYRLPAVRDALSDPAITSNPLLRITSEAMRYTVPEPPAFVPCASDAIRLVLPAALSGQQSPGDAAREMQDRGDKCLSGP